MHEEEAKVDYISIKPLFTMLFRRWWIILLAGVLCAAVFIVCTALLVDVKYQATAMMYVNNAPISLGSGSISFSSSDLLAAQSLVSTYCVILQSRTTLEQVLATEQLPYTYEQLRSMISASSVNDTEIFRIVVTSRNAEEAKVIANTIAAILPDQIAQIINGASVEVVDYATTPTAPVSRNLSRNGVLGFVLGLLLSCVAALVIDTYILDVIKSQDWLHDRWGERIPILAAIPNEDAARSSRYGYYYDEAPRGDSTRGGQD